MIKKEKVIIHKILLLLLFLIITNIAFSQDGGFISQFTGEVLAKNSEAEQYRNVKEDQAIKSGSFVSTGSDGRVEIYLPGNSIIRLKENTEVELVDVSRDYKEIFVIEGEIYSIVDGLSSNQSFIVYSDNITASVTGTQFIFNTDGKVYVIEGIVSVYNNEYENQIVDVLEGNQISVFSNQAAHPLNTSKISSSEMILIESEQELFENNNDDKDYFNDENGNDRPERNDYEEGDDLWDKFENYEPERYDDYIVNPKVEDADAEYIEASPYDKDAVPFDLSFDIGPVAYELSNGYHVSTQFTTVFGLHFGENIDLGFRVPAFFSAESPMFYVPGWANSPEWNFSGFGAIIYTIFSKVDHFEINDEESRFWFKIDMITDYTLSSGFNMEHYSNDLFYPQRREIGLILQASNQGFFGFNMMIGQLSNMSLYMFQPYIRPFFPFPFTISIDFIMDLDVLSNVRDHTDAWIFTSPYTLKYFFLSFNIETPLFEESEQSPFTSRLYVDLSMSSYQGVDPLAATYTFQRTGTALGNLFIFKDQPWGILAGLKGTIAYFIDYKLEYIHSQNGFETRFFDVFYEAQKANEDKISSVTQPVPGLGLNGMRLGLKFSWDWNTDYEDVSYVDFEYTTFFENTMINYWILGLYIEEGLVPRMNFKFQLYKKNIIHLFVDPFLNEDTMLNFEFGYRFSEAFKLNIFFRKSYLKDVDDTIIPSDTFGFETTIKF